MRSVLTLTLCVAVLFGCKPDPRKPHARVASAQPPAAAASNRAALSSAHTFPAAEVIVAIGDLHGDLSATRRALRLASVIDEADRWIGGKRVVVQTGDEIDRGDEDRAVLDLLSALREPARKAGGDVIALSGNHELMNVALDFRYVTAGGFAEFGGPNGRAEAFRPGGRYARMLADRPLVAKVGDSVFVHGGILPKHVAYGLERMQQEVRAWLLGQTPLPPMSVMSEDGPVWTRFYSGSAESTGCTELTEVLGALEAKRMVVGHTPQPKGISATCAERLYRIDVGMARAYGGTPQVLEIRGKDVRVLTEPS